MSGPQWGYLSIDSRYEVEGATPDVLWSDDSRYLACVVLHVQDVPNRRGAEGLGFRIAIVRHADLQLRYCLGNVALAEIRLESFENSVLDVTINGEPRRIPIDRIRWESA